MKGCRKLLAFFLSAVLLIGTISFGIPQTSIIANAAITKTENNTYLGTSVLENGVNTENAPKVHFDDNGDAWYVIGYNGNANGVVSSNGNMTLLAETNISRTPFDYILPFTNIYAESNLKEQVDIISETLSDKEKSVVLKRNLSSAEQSSYATQDCDGIAGPAVNNALLWPLSTKEASSVNSSLRVLQPENVSGVYSAYYWWLRSPGRTTDTYKCAAYVAGDGSVAVGMNSPVQNSSFGVRPAFNLNMSKILFSSLISGSAGEKGATYKFTILDDDMSISVKSGETIIRNGNTITVPYNVTDGTNRVSILITDGNYDSSNTNLIKYGTLTIDGNIGTNGTGSFVIPDTYDETTDKVYLIAEKTNDDNLTDYASTPILINVPDYTVKYDANGGNGTMPDQGRINNDGVALYSNSFVREGYTFKNWNTKADGTGVSYADKTTNNIAANNGEIITLYAQWEINKYTVTWVDEDGTVLETDTDVEYGTIPTYDGETPIKSNIAEKVYVFAGWTPAVSAVTGDVTYTATYGEEGAVYTITFDANGGTVTPTTATTNAEFKLDSLPIPTYEGYRFKGWFTAAEGGTQINADSVFVSNQIIYAHWEKEGVDSEDSQNNGDQNTDANESENPDNQENPDLPKDPINPDLPQEPELEVNEDKTLDYLDELRTNIAIAISAGGEQTVYWNKGDALPYDILKKLEDNPNITVVFEYSYQGENYNVSISGKNVKTDENILWYGPLYLYSLFGIDVTNFQSRGTYVVQEGDTLTDLANRFNTSVKSLVVLNQIKDSNLIYVGQTLKY